MPCYGLAVIPIVCAVEHYSASLDFRVQGASWLEEGTVVEVVVREEGSIVLAVVDSLLVVHLVEVRTLVEEEGRIAVAEVGRMGFSGQ